MNRDQIFCNAFGINIEYVHLYKSLGILLKNNNKCKNATVLFLCKKDNCVDSFCRGALKVILNSSPFNLVVTRLT